MLNAEQSPVLCLVASCWIMALQYATLIKSLDDTTDIVELDYTGRCRLNNISVSLSLHNLKF